MKYYGSSRRLKSISMVIDNLWNILSQHPLAYTFGLSQNQVDNICTTAIQQTSQALGVNYSTIYSKCVRELGFASKVDFVQAVVSQMARDNDNLYNALCHHMTKYDSVWDIEQMLGLPFNYGY